MPDGVILMQNGRNWGDWILPVAVLLSLAVHAVMFQSLSLVASLSRASAPVEFQVVKAAPPPPPRPPAEKPRFQPPKLVRKPQPLPASNQSKPVAPTAEPPKPVFGVTKDSVSDSGGVSIPVGNTLMKEPDKVLTPPDQVQPYYQPKKAPFVSSKLVEITEFPSERDRVQPEYPPELRVQGVEGTVVIEADIDASGTVVDARIKKGTGLAFDQAALKAILASRYNPARRGGRGGAHSRLESRQVQASLGSAAGGGWISRPRG